MKQVDPQLGIRLPSDLKERIRKSADQNRRSMNSEIVVLLEKILPPENEKAEVAVTTSA